MPSISEINQKIIDNYLEVGSESYNRKLLIEGMNNLKLKSEYNEKLKEYGNTGSVDVNNMNGWINNFVRDVLEGSIDASRSVIYWEDEKGRIEYNPVDGKVNRC